MGAEKGDNKQLQYKRINQEEWLNLGEAWGMLWETPQWKINIFTMLQTLMVLVRLCWEYL